MVQMKFKRRAGKRSSFFAGTPVERSGFGWFFVRENK